MDIPTSFLLTEYGFMLPTNPYNFVDIEADVYAIVAKAPRRQELEELLQSRELWRYNSCVRGSQWTQFT